MMRKRWCLHHPSPSDPHVHDGSNRSCRGNALLARFLDHLGERKTQLVTLQLKPQQVTPTPMRLMKRHVARAVHGDQRLDHEELTWANKRPWVRQNGHPSTFDAHYDCFIALMLT